MQHVTRGVVTWVSSASVFCLFVSFFFCFIHERIWTETCVTYSAFSNMNRGIRKPKWLMHHIHSTICNLLPFLCLQGTKSDEPCAGRDCSKGCKCIPEKGGRVSHVPSALCRLGSHTVKIQVFSMFLNTWRRRGVSSFCTFRVLHHILTLFACLFSSMSS